MIITKKSFSRRTVLRGLGAAIALPLLDGMVPAFAGTRHSAAIPIRRFGAVYVPMGMSMGQWTPPSEGALELASTMESLEPFKDQLVVFSGLDSKPGDGTDSGPHPRCQTAWLTGTPAKRTEGADIYAGVSMDQIVAKEFGKETQLTSLELGIESNELMGVCNIGYSCAYNNTCSWRTATQPLPMENNPRAVFERLFGASDSTDPEVRLADILKTRSILDSVTEKVSLFRKGLSAGDSVRLGEYLDSVRDVERRIQKAEEQLDQELPEVEQPGGIPAQYEEHAKLMFDLMVIAYQSDMTRVSTYMLGREASVRSYPEIGVPDSHHPLSHHGNDPEKLAKISKINSFHMSLFSYFLEKLKATPDGDGTLLDHVLLLYGSGMSDSNIHYTRNVPSLVVAGDPDVFGIKGGRHLRYEDKPLANLQLTMLESLGFDPGHFGDSSGDLELELAVLTGV
jgi:hypothetical protein